MHPTFPLPSFSSQRLFNVQPCSGSLLLYLLVISCIAIENGTFIVDLPIKNGDFPQFLYVYQRVRNQFFRDVSLPEGNHHANPLRECLTMRGLMSVTWETHDLKGKIPIILDAICRSDPHFSTRLYRQIYKLIYIYICVYIYILILLILLLLLYIYVYMLLLLLLLLLYIYIIIIIIIIYIYIYMYIIMQYINIYIL